MALIPPHDCQTQSRCVGRYFLPYRYVCSPSKRVDVGYIYLENLVKFLAIDLFNSQSRGCEHAEPKSTSYFCARGIFHLHESTLGTVFYDRDFVTCRDQIRPYTSYFPDLLYLNPTWIVTLGPTLVLYLRQIPKVSDFLCRIIIIVLVVVRCPRTELILCRIL